MSNEVKEGYKETVVGEIPEEWQVLQTKEIGEIITGTTPSTKDTDNFGGEYPFITPTDIKEKKYVNETERTLTKKGYNSSRAIPKNSVVITCIASIGKNAITPKEACTNQQINSIVCNEKANHNFIYYIINYRSEYLKELAGKTSVAIINKGEFSTFLLPLPPLPEQEKIADILSAVDEKLQKIDRIIEKTKELKKGLMQDLLTKGIGHSEFKEVRIGPKLIKLPINWKMENIKELAKVKGRIGWRGYTKSDLKDSGPLVLGAKHINNNKLDLSDPVYISREKYDESPEIKLNFEDIILVQRGSLGKVAIIDKKIGEATINPSMVILKNIKINNKYLYYYLCSKTLQNLIEADASTTAVPMISQKQIKKYLVPVPPLGEQKKIANILSSVDEKIEKKQEEKEKVKKLKKGLMQKLLTGEVRVNV